MTLQSEFEQAGIEYARRLTERHETERLAALELDARHTGNAAAFATAVAPAFAGTDTAPTPDDEDTLAADLMAAIAADTHKENQ